MGRRVPDTLKPTMRSMNFSEFCEFLLARLYELDRDIRPGADFDVRQIAEELVQDIPYTWPSDAAVELGNQGLVRPLRAGGGAVYARMSGAGRLFVEQRQADPESIVHEYQKHPTYFITISGSSNQVAVGNQGPTTQSLSTSAPSDVLNLLTAIEASIRADASLAPEQREAALEDVQAAREQLEKTRPNARAAGHILGSLGSIAAIADQVEKVVHMLGH